MTDEPRTMQFVVERICQISDLPRFKGALAEEHLPMVLWVFVVPSAERCECGGISYRIDPRQPVTDKDGGHGRISTIRGYYPAVCEHMGHLIE
jgi:hypothetical protein